MAQSCRYFRVETQEGTSCGSALQAVFDVRYIRSYKSIAASIYRCQLFGGANLRLVSGFLDGCVVTGGGNLPSKTLARWVRYTQVLCVYFMVSSWNAWPCVTQSP